MIRELIIARHGKAKRVTSFDTDFDRPLRGRGKRAAGLLGVRLREQNSIPDLVVTSTAPRALDTARLAAAAMGLKHRNIVKDRRIYEATAADLIGILSVFAVQPSRVMLVGHNPGLEELIVYLSGVAEPLPTGAAVALRMPGNWDDLPSRCAELEEQYARMELI